MTAKASPTILVVDDYTDNRMLPLGLVAREGYEVVEAENGKRACCKRIDQIRI